MQVKIYCLIDPLTLKVRYIGRTSKLILNHRLIEHISKSVNKDRYSRFERNHKENWICLLHKKGLKPIIRQMTVVEGWSESYVLESFLINKYQHRLLNHADRGEGSISPIYPEQRQRISETLKRRYKSGEIPKLREKTFYVYDKQGNFLFEKTNIKQTSIELNVSEDSLSKMLNGKTKIINKYIFYFDKVDKLESSLKLFSVYVYDEDNNEMYFETYQKAADFIGVSHKKFSESLQNKRINKYIISKKKIDNFIYSPMGTEYHYILYNDVEKLVFHSVKELAKFLGSTHSNPFVKKLECRIKKLGMKLQKINFKKDILKCKNN